MTPQEALDAIARLCRDSWNEGGYEGGDAVISADDVRAILGRVEPGPAVPAHDDLLDALTRVVAKAVVHGEDEDGFVQGYIMGTGAIHNAIRVLQNHGITARPGGFEVKMREAVPAHDIDRDALHDVLWVLRPIGADEHWIENAKRAILALLHPVEGVVLTTEERGKLAYLVEHATYSGTIDVFVSEWFEEHAEDLKVRLEGAGS